MAVVARVGTGRRPEGEMVRAFVLGLVRGRGPLIREPGGICGAGNRLVCGSKEGPVAGGVAAAAGRSCAVKGIDSGRGGGGWATALAAGA